VNARQAPASCYIAACRGRLDVIGDGAMFAEVRMHKVWRRAPRRAPLLGVWLAAALATVPAPAVLLAQQNDCDLCLNGHRFLPSTVIGPAFASDHFLNATGGGMALDLQVPVRDLDGNVVKTAGGDIGFLLLDFEYQKRVIKRLALRGTLSAIGRVGTSTEAVIASGASAVFGGSIGATVPVFQRQSWIVSLVTDFRLTNEYIVDPYSFAKRIRDVGLDDTTKSVLLHSENGNHWSVGARTAWAPNPWLGVNAIVESGEIDSETLGNRSLTELGLQAGIDFNHLYSFPVGLSLAYREQIGPGRKDALSGSFRTFELGLFYTGSRGFTIGADFFWSRVAVSEATVPDLKAAQFRLVTRLDF
jgi:hypothetical protein